MSDGMSKTEWDAIFPAWPPRRGGPEARSILETRKRQIKVSTTVYLADPWGGIAAVENEDLEGSSVVDRIGRWVITENAVIPLGAGYAITADRLEEDDWLAHLLGKTWFYDPTDMLDAMEVAHAQLIAGSTPERREELIQKQIAICLDQTIQPFYPSPVCHHLAWASGAGR